MKIVDLGWRGEISLTGEGFGRCNESWAGLAGDDRSEWRSRCTCPSPGRLGGNEGAASGAHLLPNESARTLTGDCRTWSCTERQHPGWLADSGSLRLSSVPGLRDRGNRQEGCFPHMPRWSENGLFRIARIIEQHRQLDAAVSELRKILLGCVCRIEIGSRIVRRK
jgi:hypothetical protein